MAWIGDFRAWVRAEDGQDLIEYALLVGLISLVAIVALTATGSSITGLFNAIGAAITNAT